MTKADEIRKLAKAKQEADVQLVRAYKTVFGRKGKRSPAQLKVWESLQRQLEAPTFYSHDPATGRRQMHDVTTATLNEGARSFISNLKAMVEGPEPKTETTQD